MHRLPKILALLMASLILLVIGGFASIFIRFPAVGPAPAIDVAGTQDQIECGRYLSEHVSLCLACHSQRDYGSFAGPLVDGTRGMGGERFDRTMGLPGVLHAGNITPAELGAWTDGEILRAFTAGVSRDDRALFPLMT